MHRMRGRSSHTSWAIISTQGTPGRKALARQVASWTMEMESSMVITSSTRSIESRRFATISIQSRVARSSSLQLLQHRLRNTALTPRPTGKTKMEMDVGNGRNMRCATQMDRMARCGTTLRRTRRMPQSRADLMRARLAACAGAGRRRAMHLQRPRGHTPQQRQQHPHRHLHRQAIRTALSMFAPAIADQRVMHLRPHAQSVK